MARKSEASRTLRVTVFATVMVTGLFGASSAQAATYTWTGSGGNNNWQNKGNWSGASGYPDSLSDSVIFPSVNTKHEQVDLSGAARTVLGMTFNLTGTDTYLFRSSSSGGNLINFGDLTSTHARPVTFDSSMTYSQGGNSTWNLNSDPQYMVFYGNLAGSGSITLHGGVTLNHANTYSGTFIVGKQGKLELGNADALRKAAVVVNASHGLTFATKSVDLGSLAGNTSGSVNLGVHTLTAGRLNTDTTYAGSLTSTASSGGDLHKAGTGAMTLSGAITGLHQLAVDAGSMILDGNTVDLVGSTGINLTGGDMSIVNNADVTLSGTGGTAAIGSQTLTIDGGHLAVGQITSNADGKVVLTSPVASPGLTIGMAGGQSVSSTFAGKLTGTGGFNKVGTGTLTLTGANTYTGNTVVSGGAVSISADNNLGDGGLLNLNGGTLITTGSFSLNRNIGQSNLRGNSSTIQVNAAGDTVALNGKLTGITGLTLNKTGDGALRFNQATPYAGTVRVNAGSIIIATPNALQNAVVQVNVDNGVDLATAGSDATFAGLTGSGNIHNGGYNITVNNSNNETYSGVLSGAGGLTKTGLGNLTLSAANTFSGDTNIGTGSPLEGHIVLANANALKNSTVYINGDNDLNINGLNAKIGGLAGSGALDLGSQAVTVGSNSADTTYAGVLSGDSTSVLKKYGSGDLTFTGGDNATPSDFGRFNINRGRLILDNAVVQLSGGGSYVDNSTAAGLILTGSAASLTGGRLDAGEASGGTGNIVVENKATGSFSNLLIGGAGTGHLTVQSAGRLDATNVSFGSSDAAVGTGLVTGTSSLLTANKLTFGAQSTSANMLTIQDGGDVKVTGTTRFKNPTNLLTVNGGTFSTDTFVNSSGGTPVISISDPTSGGPALTVGANNGDSSWDGVIQDASGGPGSILKTGTGTLTLTHANTYTGGTTVDGGTLLADNTTGSATGTGAVAINSGATLGGSGFIGGPVTVNADGTIAPGNSPGLLTINNDLTLGSGSSLDIQLAGLTAASQYDVLDVSGNVDLGGGALDVSLLSPFTLGPNEQFDIFNVGGTLSGTFANLGEGALVGNFSGTKLFITYNAGNGHDIALYTTSVVPIPAPVVLFASGGLMLVLVGRRRRSAGDRRPF